MIRLVLMFLCGDGCSDRVELIGAQLRMYVSIYSIEGRDGCHIS